MQKLILNQSLQQRLSPQQIQFIKLLQIPTVELAQRIEEELEINPALEEGKSEEEEKYAVGNEDSYEEEAYQSIDTYSLDDFNLKDYRGDSDEYSGYKMADSYQDEARDVMPVVSVESLQ